VGSSACGLGPLSVVVRGSSALRILLLRGADGSNRTLPPTSAASVPPAQPLGVALGEAERPSKLCVRYAATLLPVAAKRGIQCLREAAKVDSEACLDACTRATCTATAFAEVNGRGDPRLSDAAPADRGGGLRVFVCSRDCRGMRGIHQRYEFRRSRSVPRMHPRPDVHGLPFLSVGRNGGPVWARERGTRGRYRSRVGDAWTILDLGRPVRACDLRTTRLFSDPPNASLPHDAAPSLVRRQQ